MELFLHNTTGTIDELRRLHNTIVEYQPWQSIANKMTFAVCGLMLLLNLFLMVRILYVRQKAYLLVMVIIQVGGDIAGIFVAYQIAQLFSIAVDWKRLLQTPVSELYHLQHSAGWCLAAFFTTFSVSHWMFVMQYWELSLRLQNLV